MAAAVAAAEQAHARGAPIALQTKQRWLQPPPCDVLPLQQMVGLVLSTYHLAAVCRKLGHCWCGGPKPPVRTFGWRACCYCPNEPAPFSPIRSSAARLCLHAAQFGLLDETMQASRPGAHRCGAGRLANSRRLPSTPSEDLVLRLVRGQLLPLVLPALGRCLVPLLPPRSHNWGCCNGHYCPPEIQYHRLRTWVAVPPPPPCSWR